METATPTAPPQEAHHDGPQVYHDPAHDIDAPRTVFWLVVCSIAFFVMFYLLFVFFSFAIHEERGRKVEAAGTPALDKLRAEEAKVLGGEEGGSSIDTAIERLAERR